MAALLATQPVDVDADVVDPLASAPASVAEGVDVPPDIQVLVFREAGRETLAMQCGSTVYTPGHKAYNT